MNADTTVALQVDDNHGTTLRVLKDPAPADLVIVDRDGGRAIALSDADRRRVGLALLGDPGGADEVVLRVSREQARMWLDGTVDQHLAVSESLRIHMRGVMADPEPRLITRHDVFDWLTAQAGKEPSGADLIEWLCSAQVLNIDDDEWFAALEDGEVGG